MSVLESSGGCREKQEMIEDDFNQVSDKPEAELVRVARNILWSTRKLSTLTITSCIFLKDFDVQPAN